MIRRDEYISIPNFMLSSSGLSSASLAAFTDRFQPRLIVSCLINKGIYALKIIVANLKKYGFWTGSVA